MNGQKSLLIIVLLSVISFGSVFSIDGEKKISKSKIASRISIDVGYFDARNDSILWSVHTNEWIRTWGNSVVCIDTVYDREFGRLSIRPMTRSSMSGLWINPEWSVDGDLIRLVIVDERKKGKQPTDKLLKIKCPILACIDKSVQNPKGLICYEATLDR